MTNKEDILKFNGTWRSYQSRVLNYFDEYSKDGKIHIVAAPGSGKTTLGIELIRRLNKPAIVFVPTITIREQWVKRIEEAFLCEGVHSEDYISQDLKNLKFITICTYQSLHSAMTKYQGLLIEEEDDEVKREEEVNYEDFDLFEEIKKAELGIMCLDECHHLRNEWWKSLENFKTKADLQNTISLTATPPYDSSIALWNRYIGMCGEIDEEISVPELVKEGSLCPHQDYVYFNYPTKEEMLEIDNFKRKANIQFESIMNDMQFQNAILSHPCLNMMIELDKLLENPKYLSSILVYLNSKNLSYPKQYQEILGYKKLEAIDIKWLEILLQGFLYDDEQSYFVDKGYSDQLIRTLKANGMIEKRKVCMQANQVMSKLLVKSVGKCESIKTIVFHEYQCLKEKLKLLILTDFIRKEFESAVGNPHSDVHSLGVIPFFEMLRRENNLRGEEIQFGVLSGTIVVIPSKAKEKLLTMVEEPSKIKFEQLGCLDRQEYVKVIISGDSHFITGVVSELFEQGYIQVLIGTKSLLGEGWDSPCVNTLILASFVGSFMLSNQMRGRAIRTYSKDYNKASHIWHLVCVENKKDDLFYMLEDSEDFQTLQRRMENFLGLHYESNYIENGLARLSAIHLPLNKDNIKSTNKSMLKLSSQRDNLKHRWDESLAIYDEIQISDEVEVKDKFISAVVFYDAIRHLIITTICFVLSIFIVIPILANGEPWGLTLSAFFISIVFVFLIILAFSIKKIFTFKNPLARLQMFGNAVHKTMIETNILESENSKVETIDEGVIHAIYLSGGTGHDKTLFAKSMSEFLDVIENQRYILYSSRRKKKMDGYFVVPEVFTKNKESAIIFTQNIKPYIGNYKIIYTRSIEGRKILLEARICALANREDRCVTRKKVKGALE